MSCSLISRHQYFGRICSLNLRGRRANQVQRIDVIYGRKDVTESVIEAMGTIDPEKD